MKNKNKLLVAISCFLIVSILMGFIYGETSIGDLLINTTGDVIAANVNASEFFDDGVAISSTYLPLAGGDVTGIINITDGSGHSPFTYWMDGSGNNGYIRFEDSTGLFISSQFNMLHLSGQSLVVLGQDTRCDSHVYPDTDDQNQLGLSNKRWSDIYGVNLDCSEDIIAANVNASEFFDDGVAISSTYLPLTGGTLTGNVSIDDGSGNSPYTHWIGGSDADGYIYYYDGLGLLINSDGDLHLSAQNYIELDTYTKSTNMYPDGNGTRSLGSTALTWASIYAVNTYFGDAIAANDMRITECGQDGQALCFQNQTNSTVLRIEPNGDLQVRGTITENYDFGD